MTIRGPKQTRFDIISNAISNVKVTPQGFLKIPATLTRTGVLEYTRADGSTVKELRHPNEVLKKESLDTLSSAPVTEKHDAGLITPENAQHITGNVGESISNDGRLVNGNLIVQRADTIKAVQKGDLKEISPGYECDIDPTPGVWDGQRYDQIQRNIVYNHVALGPAGWGRSGPEVALRMDAAIANIPTEPAKIEAEEKESNPMKKVRVTLDSVTYEIEVAESLAPTFEAAIVKIDRERTDGKTALAKSEGAAAAAEKKNEELQARLDSATSPETIEKLVSERTSVLEKAKKMNSEAKFDGLSIEEIRKTALESAGFKRETLDSKDAAFIEGAFEAVRIEEREDGGFPGVSPKPQTRQDGGKPERTSADAHREMCERGQNAYLGKKE